MRNSCSSWLLVVLALVAPVALQGQSHGFLVRLGVDTVAVESFAREGNRIDGTLLRRSPQVSLLRYTFVLGPNDEVTSYEQRLTRADGSPMPNAPTALHMTITPDSVFRETVQGASLAMLRAAAPKGTVPGIGLSWLSYELQLLTARRLGTAYSMGGNPQQLAPTKIDARFFGADSAEIVQQGFRYGFRLGRDGQIIRADGSLTTQKFIVTAIHDPDISKLASAWSKDGGTLAVASTQFRTDKDLNIGGVTVPAGFYSLFLYPTAKGAWLIVNSQTGQWGTVYDQTKDVARIPLETHMKLPLAEERFRIMVAGDNLMMHWDHGGYGVKIRSK